MQDATRRTTEISKQNHYSKLSRKLATNKINPKCYWSMLRHKHNNLQKLIFTQT